VTRDPRLAELRAEFKLRTVFDDREKFRPCFFAALPQVDTECKGDRRAAHFIKQQIIRRELKSRLTQYRRLAPNYDAYVPLNDYEAEAPIWDLRLAVPSCSFHDDCFDGHSMPPLRVWWSQIPAEVLSWAEDFNFTTTLERLFPKEEAA
jgi:hypothetical protein